MVMAIMNEIKNKYFAKATLFMVLLIMSFVLAFFAIYNERSVFMLIGCILLVLVFSCLLYYEGICYLSLVSKKQDVLYETQRDCSVYFEQKKEKKEKRYKTFSKIFFYTLCGVPFLTALCIALGVFVVDSVFLSLVIPSILLSLCLVMFFVKEIYFEARVEESDMLEKQTVIINKKVIYYDGCCYIYRGNGFKFVENAQKFLGIKINTIHIKEEEIRRKFEEIVHEIRN